MSWVGRRMSIATLCEWTGLPESEARESLASLERRGFIDISENGFGITEKGLRAGAMSGLFIPDEVYSDEGEVRRVRGYG